MAKNNQSRDQKRKAKLKKREERSRPRESLAYSGSKYKTDAFAPLFLRTEIGIHEADVFSGRRLTDDQVEAAIERMVIRLRQRALPAPTEVAEVEVVEGGEEDLVIARILANWKILAETEDATYSWDDRIGMLRTTLNSIQVWRTQSLHSKGFLRYIEGFVKKLGVSIRQVTKDFEPIPEPGDDPVLVLGRAWVHAGSPAAGSDFVAKIEALIRAGDLERVIGITQQLMGEAEDPAIIPRLQELSIRARQAAKGRIG